MAIPALSALDIGWNGSSWPPENEITGLGVYCTGTVVGIPRRIEVRRSDKLQGFLAAKKTSDLAARYLEFTVRLDDKHNLEEIKKNVATSSFFQRIDTGGQRFFEGLDVVKFWAPITIVSDLAIVSDVPDPLIEGDKVKVGTQGGTLLTKNVEIITLTTRKGKMGMMGETHMFGVVQGGPVQVDSKGGLTEKIFAAKAQLPAKKEEPKGDGDVKDEEWN